MKVVLMCIGKVSYAPIRETIERYAARIPHYVPFEIKELPDVKNARSLSQDQQCEDEGNRMLAQIAAGDCLMLFDEHGKEYTSMEFSRFIADKMVSLSSRLVLAIGGPYGFSKSVYQRADGKISLSRMTFPHEMARLFAIEQIYRAMTIQRGEPYHHE